MTSDKNVRAPVLGPIRTLRNFIVAVLAVAGTALADGNTVYFSILLPAEAPPPDEIVQQVVMRAPAATVLSLDLRLTYAPPTAPLVRVEAGSLASGMILATNIPQPGVILVGLAGAQPAGGEGPVVIVAFGTGSGVTLSLARVEVNEGAMTAAITANTPPVLTVPPDQTVSELATLTVTNTARDADKPTNTFAFGLVSAPAGVNLSATTGVLTWTPSAAQGPSTNLFTVKVTDNGVPPLSDMKSFTVVVHEPATITAQPQSQTVIAGVNVAFNVSATGTAPLSYQWQRSVDGGVNWSNLNDDSTYSGVRTATLMVSHTTTAMNGNQFRCVASNSAGSATSAPATLGTMDGTLDTDGDGHTDFQEFIAGTDPLSPASALRITAIREVGSNVELDFDSISGKMYGVERKNSLSDATWAVLETFTSDVTGPHNLVDPGAGTGNSKFYRIKGGPNGEVVTDPAGYYGVTLKAGPNAISVPLHNFATARGLVGSVSGSTVTVTGNPNWPASAFAPKDGYSQYLLLVRKDASASPGIAGDWWTIASNTGNTLTLSAGSDVLSSLLGSGDQIEVRRLTSMKDLFGTSATLVLNQDSNGNAAAGDFSQADVIRFISGTSFRAPIFYHDGTLLPAGYYVEGGNVGPLDGATITVLPGQGFMVFRKTGSSATTVRVNGQVQVSRLTEYLKVGPNVIGSPFAAAAPIGTSGLKESGWVSDHDGSAAAGDWSKASLFRLITGTSFGPSVFHHDGSILSPAGWYDANGVLNNDFPLQPGRAYIFFITAGNPVRWHQAFP